MRQKEPNFKERLCAIDGNITEKNLNINTDLLENELKNNINIVFHLAGTINLDQDLKSSLQINVLGTKNVLDLAKKNLTNLQAFVHMSSVYANGNQSFIEEKIYSNNIDPNKVLNLLEWMEDDWLNLSAKNLTHDKPNTFTYSKWLSETLLQNECGENFPLVILRPSTIGAAFKEPFPVIVQNQIIPT